MAFPVYIDRKGFSAWFLKRPAKLEGIFSTRLLPGANPKLIVSFNENNINRLMWLEKLPADQSPTLWMQLHVMDVDSVHPPALSLWSGKE